MAAATAVAAVGAAFRHVFGTVEMARACASFTGAAKDLYIVYEV